MSRQGGYRANAAVLGVLGVLGVLAAIGVVVAAVMSGVAEARGTGQTSGIAGWSVRAWPVRAWSVRAWSVPRRRLRTR
jgi:hypothetical protein